MKIKKIICRVGEKTQRHPKVFIFPEGENIIANLANRHSRPFDLYKKEVLPMMMDQLEQTSPTLHGLLKAGKFNWSQKCGCTCGCSPGFNSTAFANQNIFVTVTD